MNLALSPTGKSQSLSWYFFVMLLVVLQAILFSVSHQRAAMLASNNAVLLIVRVVATGISTYNALISDRSARLFWIFVTSGSGLWALNSLLGVLYVAGPGKSGLDPMLSGSILFLHTAMLFAAMAARPHVEELEARFHRAALNSLLLLSFWIFVYVFLLVSGEFPHWNSRTIQWFAILYCAANAILAVVTAIVAVRAHGAWRSVYLSLFGASAIYTVGSLIANLRVADNSYAPGWLNSFSIVAACLLVRAAICGKGAATKLAEATLVESNGYHYMGISVMLTSATVLLLLLANQPRQVSPARLAALLTAGLLFTAVACIREYLVQRRFTLDIDRARDQLYLAMQSGKSIAWDLNLATGEGAWSGDLEIFFGIPATTCILPEQQLYRCIHPDDRQRVSQAISDALKSAKPFAATFRMILPNNASMWVSSRGRFYYKASGAPSRMLGVAVDIEDEQHSKAALEQKDSRLRLVLKSTAEGILGIDLNDRCTFCNPAALNLLGFSHEAELVGQRIHDLIHHTYPDGKPYPSSKCPILAALHNGETHSDREVFWKVDGKPFPVEYWAYPQREKSGITGAVITFIDITERRQAESSLRETEIRFRSMADRAPVLLWMSREEAVCNYFNRTWLEFTGRSLKAEFGNGWIAGIHPEDRQRYLNTYNESYVERKPFTVEYRLKRHDGEYRWILANGVPRFSSNHEFKGYIGSATDVTQVRRAEELLEKSEEEFSLAFEAAHLGWWVWNRETGHMVASDGTRVVLGLPLGSEATLQSFLDTVHPEDYERVYQTWQRAVEDGAYYFVEYRAVWPDGTIHWVESRGRTSCDSQGKPMQVVGVTMDITERKRTEDTLRAVGGRLLAAQEEERARIARELHDDVCQRLAILGIELERMKDQSELPADTLQEWASRLAQFTGQVAGDLQALSHELHSSKLEILGITAAMRSFCAEFAKQHHIEVNFISKNVPFPLSPDVSVCLYRILQEGLHNAAKHSRANRIFAELRGDYRVVELIIKDSGVGFDPARIVPGRGLGLISMRERMNLVRGTLSIESRPKRGTTIRARAPVEEMNAAQCA